MSISWPGVSSGGGNMDEAATEEIRSLLDEFGDVVARQLRLLGLQPHTSPIHRPFSLVALKDSAKVLVVTLTVVVNGVAKAK